MTQCDGYGGRGRLIYGTTTVGEHKHSHHWDVCAAHVTAHPLADLISALSTCSVGEITELGAFSPVGAESTQRIVMSLPSITCAAPFMKSLLY
ncbi:hypothetical protein KIN20_030674 [Parelaphostrongylus tenuis]|uniref:Uncharacterized protein n=1 Tax=Parelaphostrongylus tenuis TaxID=148309 RepID=A0AAD5R4F5_PARTN|nr:hypothetical protein KIN20_030674 [Parelaphostrongylus tenuis]